MTIWCIFADSVEGSVFPKVVLPVFFCGHAKLLVVFHLAQC